MSGGAIQSQAKPPALPAGVTLQAIDGETLTSSTTMSMNYYTRNGYRTAAAMGWDSPSFFSIGTFLCDYDTAIVPNAYTTFNTLGWNTIHTWAHLNNTAVTANNVSTVGSYQSGTLAGNNLVGINTYDEPSTYAQGVSTPLGTEANNVQDVVFWQCNFTINWANGTGLTSAPAPGTPTSILAQAVTTPNGNTRHLDLQSMDQYWFSGSRDPNETPFQPINGKNFYGLGSNMTADQGARGSNYGDTIDRLRSFQASGTPAPLGVYLETGDPYWGTGSTSADVILPAEFNWAAWSMVIHGARMLYIFDHFGPTGGGTNADNVLDARNTFFNTVQGGQSVSMATQVATTCNTIGSLAPIINAPFALSYASIPSGYTFPTATTSLAGGAEVMTKWYQGGSFTVSNSSSQVNGVTFPNGFYIFATTRNSQTVTNYSVTFTLNDSSASSVTELLSNTSIPVVGGQFSFTFAAASTVAIFRVAR